jgi:hypothetical protein
MAYMSTLTQEFSVLSPYHLWSGGGGGGTLEVILNEPKE